VDVFLIVLAVLAALALGALVIVLVALRLWHRVKLLLVDVRGLGIQAGTLGDQISALADRLDLEPSAGVGTASHRAPISPAGSQTG
jgi:hypothetical protein